MEYEFIDYVATPGEKHMGIAEIRIDRRYVLRMKVMIGNNGGMFVFCASYKMGKMGDKDHYVAAFEFDSNTEKKKVSDFIIDEVVRRQSKPVATLNHNQSALNSPQPTQSPQGYQMSPPPQNSYQAQGKAPNPQYNQYEQNPPF